MNSRMNTERAALSSFMWASLSCGPPAWPLSADLQSDPIAEARAQEHIGSQYQAAQQGELLGECGCVLAGGATSPQRGLDRIDQPPVDQGRRRRPQRGSDQA